MMIGGHIDWYFGLHDAQLVSFVPMQRSWQNTGFDYPTIIMVSSALGNRDSDECCE